MYGYDRVLQEPAEYCRLRRNAGYCGVTGETLPQAEATLPQAPVQPPVGKRKWVRRELPPPREGREAFTKAMRHVQENLQKRKN